MIKEQEMLEIELKENFEKDIDIIRNHITSLRLIGVGLSNTLNEKDKEIEKLSNIINEFMEELKWQRKVSLSLNEAFAVSRIDVLINCLQELKGDGSNGL